MVMLSLLTLSCVETFDSERTPSEPPIGADVYIPVYGDSSEAFNITVETAKNIVNPAKIFTYNKFLIVNIENEGFHVIDNSNPVLPRPLFFIKVPGSRDIAIKDGKIFTDNYSDLVAFSIDENDEVIIDSRISNVMNNQLFPPFRGVYFECVDPEMGIVIDWERGESENANCYRP
jgi:hypothetical protein